MANVNGLTSSSVKSINEAVEKQSANYSAVDAAKLYESVAEDLSYGLGIDKAKLLNLIEDYISSNVSGTTLTSKEQNALQGTVNALKSQIEKLTKTYGKKKDAISEKQDEINKKGEEMSSYLESAEAATEDYIATQTAVINGAYSHAWSKLNSGDISPNEFSSTMRQYINKSGKRSLTSTETEKYLSLVDAAQVEIDALASEASNLISQKNSLTNQLGTLKSLYNINCKSLENQKGSFNNDYDTTKPAYSISKLNTINSFYLNEKINISALGEGDNVANTIEDNPQLKSLSENWDAIISNFSQNDFSFKETMYALFDSNVGLFKNCGISYYAGQKDLQGNPTFSIGEAGDETVQALYNKIASSITAEYGYSAKNVQGANISDNTSVITDTANIFEKAAASSSSDTFVLSADEAKDIVSESFAQFTSDEDTTNIFASVITNASENIAEARARSTKAESDMKALEISNEAKGRSEIASSQNINQSQTQTNDEWEPVMSDIRELADKEKFDIDMITARQIYYALKDRTQGDVTASMVFGEYQNRTQADDLTHRAMSEINSLENAQYVNYNDLYDMFASGRFKSVDDAVGHFSEIQKEAEAKAEAEIQDDAAAAKVQEEPSGAEDIEAKKDEGEEQVETTVQDEVEARGEEEIEEETKKETDKELDKEI